MNKPQPTLSIISICNNHCPYCFQGQYDNKEKEILSFSEIIKIVNWLKQEYTCLIIMGGEPLLHPNLLEIMSYLSNELDSSKLITNLITQDTNLIKKLALIKNLKWLINTTSDKDNKKIFNRNLEILLDNKSNDDIAFSLTLTGNKKLDFLYIDNLFKIIEKIKFIIPINLRVTPNMPQKNKVYTIQNYDEQFLYFLKNIKNIKVNLSLDCGFNFCFVSKKVLKELFITTNLSIPKPVCTKAPYIDIGVDKKISFCHYVSDEYFPPKYYWKFNSPSDYINYFKNIKNEFMFKYKNICKKNICPIYCDGVCPAILIKIKDKKCNFL